MECFVTLKPGITKEQVEATMPTLINKYYDDIEEKLYRFNLQLVTEMHSDSVYGGRFTDNQFWTLTIIGFLLILIACINFVNLATAQILNRSKEVGVRKILGSLRSHIFLQFLVETGLIAVAGLIVACLMVYLSLPWVNALLNERLSMRLFSEWQLPAFVFTVLLFVIFAAGMYPALLMTRFQPAAVLKSKFSGSGGLSLRRILIVTQFTVSQLLIISMIVIHNQMEYTMNTDLGFAREAVIMMPIPNGDRMKMKTLGARFMQVPGVYETTKCFEAPGSSSSSSTGARYDNREREEIWEVSLKDADEKYAPTFDLKFVAGRNLLPADSIREFLVNETFVKKLGVASPEEVIGKKLSVNGGTMNGTIEGVVKDFYTQSFHDPIAAICISMNFDRFQYFAVKIDMSQAQAVINEFNRMWDDTYPDNVFGYRFVDDKIAEFYKRDNAVLRLVESVSMIAIVISCLGLYGMVSFMSVRKTKEIGVRKVLGASVTSILWLFAREFAVLIGIAFATAAPLAWLLMNKWLQTFVYHIDISGVSFIFAITGTLAVAAITVGYHSMRSALANPAVSLHSE
jgi:ABC-type antimicrobial peptide transport system permease subunit